MNAVRLWLLASLLASPAFAQANNPDGCPKPPSCPAVQGKAPPFGLPLVSGGRTSLRELLEKKRPIVIDFWRHDCAPCLADLVELEKLAVEWGDKVSVQLVHVGGSEEQMSAKLDKYGGHLACAFDGNQCTGTRWCVEAFPQLWVVDANGVLRAHLSGEQKSFAASVRAAVAPLLAAGK